MITLPIWALVLLCIAAAPVALSLLACAICFIFGLAALGIVVIDKLFSIIKNKRNTRKITKQTKESSIPMTKVTYTSESGDENKEAK